MLRSIELRVFMQTPRIALESRINALVDDDLFRAFWDAVDFFKTKDLVLFYNTNKTQDPVRVYEREKFLASPGVPASLKSKFEIPATETSVDFKNCEAAFWLLVAFSGGEVVSAAINANLIGPDH
jgi:hypothetical protein